MLDDSPSEHDPLIAPPPLPSPDTVEYRQHSFHWTEFRIRLLVFFMVCCITVGNYFCYDNPAALQDRFRADLRLSTVQFSLLYSCYSWPNIVFCFLCGLLVDRLLGVRFGGVLFTLVVVMGQMAFAMGAWINSLTMMCVGRALFGIGSESLIIIQNAYIARWFRGRGFHVVSGLVSTVSCLASTLNMTLIRRIYNTVDRYQPGPAAIGITLLLSVTVCFLSFLAALLLAYIDLRNQPNVLSPAQSVQLRDLKQLHPSVWLASLISPLVTSGPFVALGLVFLMSKYDLHGDRASTTNSIPYIVVGIGSPLFGLIIDYSGRNITWLFVSALLLLASFCTLAFTFVSPYICLIGIGLASSIMNASIWPMVALVSPNEQLATVYGIMEAFQNVATVVFSTVGGVIVDHFGYLMLLCFYQIGSMLALFLIWILFVLNSREGGILNMTASQRASVDTRFSKVE